MTSSDSTSAHRPAVGGLTLDDRLDRIEESITILGSKIDDLANNENDVGKLVARIQDKLELHDKILMGVCGAIGLSFIGALLSLIIKI